MTSSPVVSLIVPTHDGASYISKNVAEIVQTLERLASPFEVLVVCDGHEATARVLAEITDERVVVLGYEQNLGKGHAICHGIAHARGRLIGWLDADLDIAPDAILDAVSCLHAAPIDAAIGSKRHPRSDVDYPAIRRLYSWCYQMLVRLLFRVNARDTQVGAKVFRREMVDVVAPLLLIKRYAFDLEVLAVGTEFGFDRIEEIPVRIDYKFSGTGINREAVWRMFLDTLAIAYRIHIRHWYVRQFAALQRERSDAATRFEQAPASSPESPPIAAEHR